jgi:hypothetical protein
MSGRRTHPSARTWRSRPARLADRLAIELAADGSPWPYVAAAVVAVRAAAGLDAESFAAALGLSPDDVRRLEHDGCPPFEVPAAVRALGTSVDWAAVATRSGQGLV